MRVSGLYSAFVAGLLASRMEIGHVCDSDAKLNPPAVETEVTGGRLLVSTSASIMVKSRPMNERMSIKRFTDKSSRVR